MSTCWRVKVLRPCNRVLGDELSNPNAGIEGCFRAVLRIVQPHADGLAVEAADTCLTLLESPLSGSQQALDRFVARWVCHVVCPLFGHQGPL
ncbi:hypothetical protein NPS53_09670 [Pseudomonas putida]|uniref:hypothetical protein n=1 Tax=Pseudomonas putida TaxID=303 RepID=UPI002363702D|nr:hypothetical protein [Pseudomonas putida]MDD2139846.1 hypothetical protein [Pseudomonas putida]HDS1721769.1 hypothetical protein [Pseudomonas putida]